MTNEKTASKPAPLNISPQDLGQLGLNRIAFIKPVIEEDERRYVVHTADGTAVRVFATYELAELAIRQHDLEPLSVH